VSSLRGLPPVRVTGHIVGPRAVTDIGAELQAANSAVIGASLLESDPPLLQSLTFGTAFADERHAQRASAILRFRTVLYADAPRLELARLDRWLAAFEALLARMYWEEAQVVCDAVPPLARRSIAWVPTRAARRRMLRAPFPPVAEWVYSEWLLPHYASTGFWVNPPWLVRRAVV
jgi:hypothetical protein